MQVEGDYDQVFFEGHWVAQNNLPPDHPKYIPF